VRQILVVDDEPTICEFVREFLEDEGFAATCAPSGVDALRAINTSRPDLVLMDIMMPGLDGREVVRLLQEHPTHSAIPVILMSAAVRWDSAIDGPIQFIGKPFDLERLLTMVNRTLDPSVPPDGQGMPKPGPRPIRPDAGPAPRSFPRPDAPLGMLASE
jgi:CheY-like chemotaxis protein